MRAHRDGKKNCETRGVVTCRGTSKKVELKNGIGSSVRCLLVCLFIYFWRALTPCNTCDFAVVCVHVWPCAFCVRLGKNEREKETKFEDDEILRKRIL